MMFVMFVTVESKFVENNYPKSLPKNAAEITNGGVFRQRIRCGKATCRCRTGPLHEGYYYYIYRVGGRLRKAYIPKRLVETITAMVLAARAERSEQRIISRKSRELLTEFGAHLRDLRGAPSSKDIYD